MTIEGFTGVEGFKEYLKKSKELGSTSEEAIVALIKALRDKPYYSITMKILLKLIEGEPELKNKFEKLKVLL